MKLNAIDSDSDLVVEALNFLKSNQNEDGTFSETMLKIIPSNPDETPKFRDFHVTCFVLNAFLVNREYVDENYSEVTERINKTMSITIVSVDNYDAAYASYLYASNSNDLFATNIMRFVQQEAHTDGTFTFWDLKNKKEISGSTKVLIASYAIMTYIKLKETKLAEPIIKWLIKEKDKNGNFHGTFDTNVALEALTEVESYSGVNQANIVVKIKTEKPEIIKVIQVNSLITSEPYYLPKTVTSYSIEIEGEGFAMITTNYEFLMDVSKASDDFKLEADAKKKNEENSELNLCASYSGQIKSGEFTPIMEIEINEGFEYDTKSDPMRQNAEIKVIIQSFLN